MENIKVCRVCLVIDVKMFNLYNTDLQIYLEQIMNLSTPNVPVLPPYVCFECASLIQKCCEFTNKCHRGQEVLFSIILANGQLSLNKLKQIDRVTLKLSSKLTCYKTCDVLFGDEVPTSNILNLDIKYEPPDEIIVENEDSIKEECNFDDIFAQIDSSGDDEPLSMHQLKKEKRKVKKKEKKSKRKKNDQTVLHNKEGSEENNIIEEGIISKPKRGRPKKVHAESKEEPRRGRRTLNTGGVVLDEFDLSHHVDIIELTLEEQIEEVNKRQQSSNYNNAPYQCHLCYKGFIESEAWNHHLAKHDPEQGDLVCPVCKFRFKDKRSLQKHSNNHDKIYSCKACNHSCKTLTQAKQHQRWHKGVTYSCQYCDEVLTKWTSYLSHVRIKHPSSHICGVCGYSFVSQLGLTMHATMMHKDEVVGEERRGPHCAECDVKFVSEEAWKRHLVTSVRHSHAQDFSKGCRTCGETFATSDELKAHHRSRHARKRPKNYGKRPSSVTWPVQCDHCPEMIPNGREHWKHYRRKHPDKNYPIRKDYVCDLCGKGFRGNAFLVYHRRTHFAERAFPCGECGKAFHNRTNLHMHARTHSDARPYPCDACCKAFKSKGALDRHYRCHTGVKPYECEVCGKAFAQSNSRKLHVATVHLKQPAPYISRSRLERRNKAPLPKEQPQQFLYH